MFDLYVYYKVREDNASRLAPLVRSMQSRLPAAGQLKRRPQAKDGLQTWMEVYPSVDTAFETTLDAAVVEAGIASLIDGPRHTEVFTDLTPCA